MESLLRLEQIIGNKKKGIPPIIPVGRSTFLAAVKKGTFPAPIHITARLVAWRSQDIKDLVQRLSAQKG
jgi:prophage regulatory protein